MTRDAPPTSGIYGKVPSFGDYVRRGLPSSFVEPWNAWISTGIAKSRDLLGEGWMRLYLTSPPWRFLVEPGILGTSGWIGVLASSVDQVSRCYPVTVAVALHEDTRLQWTGDGIADVAERLETIALGLIDGGVAPDGAMARIDELLPLAARSGAPVALLGRGGTERLMRGSLPSALAGLALRWMSEADAGHEGEALSVWWHGGWNGSASAQLITAGLPATDCFACFLDGAWTDRGWTEQFHGGSPT